MGKRRTQRSRAKGILAWATLAPVTLPRDLPAPLGAAVGALVRELRLARGLSMFALGKLAGVDDTTICLFEGGRKKPSIDTAVRLAAALGISVGILFTLAERRG